MKTLVRLPNWIGDAAMATPAISLLAGQGTEDETLAVWGPPKTATLFHHFPGVDRVFELDEKSEPERLSEIQEAGFDRVFLFTNSYSTARAAMTVKIPERIGYRTQWRGRLLTRPVPCGPRVRALPMVDYYLNLLPGEGRKRANDRQPRLFCSEEERARARRHLREGFEGQVVAITPGAAFGPAKQWFPENYRRLARKLAESGCRVAVLGGENDRELGNEILTDAPPERRKNLAGGTNLRDLMALIAESDALATNDSGPMHIADAVGTPAVAFFGSTDSTWTGPQASHHKVLQAEVLCNPCFLRECPLGMECMKSLTVERATAAMREILGA